jgi:hypothetical protein
LPEDSGKSIDGRLMSKHELKRFLSVKLRDPLTSTRDFVSMLSMYRKLNPGWDRKPRRVEKEKDVNDIVLQLERQQRKNRAKIANISDRKGSTNV